MSTRRFQGGAVAVSQLQTYAFGGTWVIGETITVVIGSKSWTYTIASATIATFLTAMATAYEALSATDYPELAEQTASSSTTNFLLTADTAGVPFTATISTDSSLGTIDSGASSAGTATTASAGPYDWSTAANWSGGAVPVNSDVAILDMPTPIRYGLDQSGVTLTSLTFGRGFNASAQLGLPQINQDGTAYPEYRGTSLAIGATTVTVDAPDCGLIRLDTGTAQTAVTVQATGSSIEDNVEGLLWKGTHASNVLNVLGTSEVGVAVLGGESATIATMRVEDPGVLRLGTGCTLTTVNVNGGTVEVNAAVTTYTLRGGTTTHRAGAVTTATLTNGSTLDYRSSGTATTVVIGSGSTVTVDNDPQARTFTNLDMYSGATLIAENGTLTATNGVDLNFCTLDDVTLRLPRNIRLSLGSPS